MLLRPLLRRSVLTATRTTSYTSSIGLNTTRASNLRAAFHSQSLSMASNAADSAGAIAQAQQAENTTSTAAAPTHNAPAEAQPA